MRSKTQTEGALKRQLKNAGAASGRGSGTMAALLSFGGVCALPWMLHLNGEEKRLGYSNSILSVFLFCLLFALAANVQYMVKRAQATVGITVFFEEALPEAEIIIDAACTAGPDAALHEKALDLMEALQMTIINR